MKRRRAHRVSPIPPQYFSLRGEDDTYVVREEGSLHSLLMMALWLRYGSCLAGWTGLPRRSKDLQALMMALRTL